MKRIYTKTGDRGTTGIHGGARVPKDDIRIEANGSEPQTYFTTTLDDSVQYDKLRARTGEIVGQARITLTYYFK